LTLKQTFESLADPDALRVLIARYSSNIGLPIYLTTLSSTEPVNKPAPWYRNQAPSSAECIAFLKETLDPDRFAGIVNAIEVITVRDPEICGVLCIPGPSQEVDTRGGWLDIYCRRVFVCQDDRSLLANAAAIVRGILDCPNLTLTLDRERYARDQAASRASKRIDSIVRDHLATLGAPRSPLENDTEFIDRVRRLTLVISFHGDTLKVSALNSRDDGYFLSIADYIRFTTNKSETLTLPEYVTRASSRGTTKPTIYYHEKAAILRTLQYVIQRVDTNILDASDKGTYAFLQRYGRLKGIACEPVEDLLATIVVPAHPTDSWPLILDLLRRQDQHPGFDLRPSPVAFEPEAIPLLVATSAMAGTDPILEDIVSRVRTLRHSSSRGKVLGDQLLEITSRSKLILYVNIRNPLMARLERLLNQGLIDDDVLATILHDLLDSALSLADIPLPLDHYYEGHTKPLLQFCAKLEQVALRRDVASESRARIQALEGRLEGTGLEMKRLQEVIADQEQLLHRLAPIEPRRLNCRPFEVFVMRPFVEDTRWVLTECIQPACKTHGLRTIHLEESLQPGRITDEIRSHILECGILIADLSSSNPNVLYEVGAAHALGKAQQTVFLADNPSSLPFNIRDFRVIPFGNARDIASLERRISQCFGEIKTLLATT